MGELIDKTMNYDEASIPSYSNITEGYQAALKVVDDVVLKKYVTELSNLEIVPLNKRLLESNIRDNVRFFKITEMVYEKDELAVYKFASVFNALSMTDSSIFIIINSDGVKTDFYMGVRSLDEYRTISSLKNMVENAMKGQFPGIKTFDDYTIDDMQEILESIKEKNISVVSCVANDKAQEQSSNQTFVQGLEKLVLSMQGEKYTGIIIANSTSQTQLRELRKGYETVYTQLSPLANTQVNYTSNSTMNYSVSESKGDSHSKQHTENYSEQSGETKTSGSSSSHSDSRESAASKTVKGVASAASLLGAALAPMTGGVSLAVGGVVSGGLGMLGAGIARNISDSTSTNESIASNFSKTFGSSEGTTDTTNYNISKSEGYAKGITEGLTLTLHDKAIENILGRIDKQLERIDEFESLGMYECAAYFLSDDPYSAESAASTYKAIMRGENSGVEVAAINSWGQYQKEKTQLLAQYVKNFIHPVFKYNGPTGAIEVTPCALVSGNELAIHMGLPRQSVCGLPVVEYVNFAREIVSGDGNKVKGGINLGKIFNMGNAAENKAVLDVNSLAMHTFITGATGSGKSNTVYEMIRQLDNYGIKYLIVEPAKGEYKHVFGMRDDVQVYGTNPYYTPLLKINPFKFPKGVHVLEHVDRLVEIFNVCWPMYAAMPAVLKDSILRAYESCGWNMILSQNKEGEFYPTFEDVLRELDIVINTSAYSADTKGDYIGSLSTRLRSLTNGLNGQIFVNDEVDNASLFDGKTIVDLSRVGSMETKSLLMGILVMRLSEHRMAEAAGMNQPLKHVTVLEEAHNILKRTSTEQNMEGANMMGKSVEMISNAIAEMRTYGEGFIIADQSPNAVDISAIRNTNTKIIMRLPDEDDRQLAGRAAALKDEQIPEIAKLPKGVAIVYQNDWLEPVQCKVNRYNGEEKLYENPCINLENTVEQEVWFKYELLKLLLKGRVNEEIDVDVEKLHEVLKKVNLPTKDQLFIRRLLQEYIETNKLELWEDYRFENLAACVVDILNCKEDVEKQVKLSQNFENFNPTLERIVRDRYIDVSNEMCLAMEQCLIRNLVTEHPEHLPIYAAWRETRAKEVR